MVLIEVTNLVIYLNWALHMLRHLLAYSNHLVQYKFWWVKDERLHLNTTSNK